MSEGITAAEVDRRLENFITDRFVPAEEKCKEVNDLAVTVAEIKGKVEVITRLMWGIILALVGLLIQGAIG